ncbi:MAG: BlaI/MecI/CopY family transcriptional regulator [Planctomycetota bacterium]
MAETTGEGGFQRPTAAEMELLRLLWEFESGTVRQFHEDLLERGKTTTFSTTMKLLRIMHAKGLVVRDERWRPHVYSPALPQAEMQKQLVDDFRRRVFGGSAGELLEALLAGALSNEDLDAIRDVLTARGL